MNMSMNMDENGMNISNNSFLFSALTKLKSLPTPIPLTKSGSSWIIHLSKFAKAPTYQIFQEYFQSHPMEYHNIQLYGKTFAENRYSQLYVTHESVGETYKYSGTTRKCHVLQTRTPTDGSQTSKSPLSSHEQFVLDLCQMADCLLQQMILQGIIKKPPTLPSTSSKMKSVSPSKSSSPEQYQEEAEQKKQQKEQPTLYYNCCLANWYQPQHSIGLHSDDEPEMNLTVPIISLSWGGPRRFLLRPKSNNHTTANAIPLSPVHEIVLQNGDLLIMGGNCQQEFKHEIPRIRKKDGLVNDRISWTIRSMNNMDHKRRKRQEQQHPQLQTQKECIKRTRLLDNCDV